MDALLPQLMDDVLNVSQAAGQAVDPGHNECVAGPEELHQCLKLGAPAAACTGRLLGADDGTSCGCQRRLLDGEVLIGGADAGIAVERDGHGWVSREVLEVDEEVS